MSAPGTIALYGKQAGRSDNGYLVDADTNRGGDGNDLMYGAGGAFDTWDGSDVLYGDLGSDTIYQPVDEVGWF